MIRKIKALELLGPAELAALDGLDQGLYDAGFIYVDQVVVNNHLEGNDSGGQGFHGGLRF